MNGWPAGHLTAVVMQILIGEMLGLHVNITGYGANTIAAWLHLLEASDVTEDVLPIFFWGGELYNSDRSDKKRDEYGYHTKHFLVSWRLKMN